MMECCYWISVGDLAVQDVVTNGLLPEPVKKNPSAKITAYERS
jgi:hypothetical protein